MNATLPRTENPAELSEENLLRFNGTFTFQNRKTGTHKTLKIAIQKDDADFQPGQRLVMVFTGTDNTNWQHYTTVGKLVPIPFRGFVLKPWSKYLCQELGKQAGWMVDVLNAGGHPGVEIIPSKKCRCCNRKLTNPESARSGIGPECAKKGGGF